MTTFVAQAQTQAQAQIHLAEQPTTKNDPAALGPIRSCALGTNKMTKLTKFEEWLDEAENRMAYIGIGDDKQKIILLKSWGGPELIEFMKSNVKIQYTEMQATVTAEAIPADTYSQVIEKVKGEMMKLVNRTMAMHDLLTTKQGSRNWMDFIHELETKAKVLNFEQRPYTKADSVKDAAIFGMTDTRLREKALAEDPDLEPLVKWGQAREAGREDAHSLKETGTGGVRKIGWSDSKPPSKFETMSADDLEDLIESLNVMKLKKQGKYSSRYKKGNCKNCRSEHPEGRCPAQGK